jgi:D-serine deaminase-like pyridoxal phosphate-dependent protein
MQQADAPLIADLETPCLLLDEVRMERNITRLKNKLHGLDVPLRPHLKTAKSIEISKRLTEPSCGPAAVSTLREAEVFAAAGFCDLLYAVGIAPGKLARVIALRGRGTDLKVVVDSVEAAEAVAEASRSAADPIPTLIEISSDRQRAGVRPYETERLVTIGRALHKGGAALMGVMTHAGGSYDARGKSALEAAAEQERSAAVSCAQSLRDAGLPVSMVSVGSTPTAHFATDLAGVSEVRAGVFVFFDLMMAGIGVCRLEDIAISVLTTVIGHQDDPSLMVVDAGWMALSRDRGTANQEVDQGYGLVLDIDGRPLEDLIVTQTSQEHGIIAVRPGSQTALPHMPIGTKLRILPNHACATAAQHPSYHVIGRGENKVTAIWERFGGW